MSERPGYIEVTRSGRKVFRKQIECDCGETVTCYGFTNTCECGLDYNMSGQRLASRSQWGEDTGEHPSDVARITGDEDW